MLVFILGLLFLLGLFYVKRRLDGYDKRLELLTETIQTMAGIRMEEIDKESEESEDEEESEEEEEEESQWNSLDEPVDEPVEPQWNRLDEPVETQWNRVVEPIELELDPVEPEIKTIQLPKITVSDDDVSGFDGLSLKELKEKVAELNGPKLKTKKECIDFLKIKSKNEL